MLLKTLLLNLRNLRNISHGLNVQSCFIIRCQNYARFASRKYAEIVNEDELFDIEEHTTPSLEEEKKIKSRRRRQNNKSDEVKIENETIFETLDEEKKKPKKSISTKLYENEKLMASIMMSVRTKKKRMNSNSIVLESKRLIQDAMKTGLVPQKIIFSREQDIEGIPYSKSDTQLFKVPYRTIQLWSTLTTSPGVMGIFEKPKPLEVSQNSLPITIICDNIRDPQNMGSILRAAAAVGCEKIILTKGCVDFWESKVVRSGAGAHFRVPIYDVKEWNEIHSMIPSEALIFLADNNIGSNKTIKETQHTEEITSKKLRNVNNSKNRDLIKKLHQFDVVPYYNPDYTKNEIVLIVGGETEGLSENSLQLMETRNGLRVNIPLANKMDSLNAGMALGIIVFEVKRQFFNVKGWKKIVE